MVIISEAEFPDNFYPPKIEYEGTWWLFDDSLEWKRDKPRLWIRFWSRVFFNARWEEKSNGRSK